MSHQFKYKHISPMILELYWPASIDESTLMEMMSMKTHIQKIWQDELLEVSMGYHCLSLHFKSPFRLNDVLNELEHIAEKNGGSPVDFTRKKWMIPVWYSGKDLEKVAKHTGMAPDKIITLHQTPNYLLHFYGFMPGFMYLGGLDNQLFVPRKKQPDPLIEKGAVAIGGKQTGIYPMNSPGGWNVIGRTPVQLFDVKSDPPLKPQPGDKIKFEAVTEESYQDIISEIKEGNYQLQHEKI
ncbi:5-oxoprolinase subunit PxpB [Echinicola soli]|uniref:5-oxoprolinase subunit PxpB n=1 Tax=Echinicola soli TaxID=2591634 RepID=A0A514CJZ7_9BACT|nr:5-oxoprolinase subunit PxpB [Echinicola soli]QDH80128.1 5-oxoprolinase subunit PxpB [Echinicola soli]